MTERPSPPPGPGVSGFGESSSRRNWLAIVSLITGLTCLGLVGVVLGHLALRAVAGGQANNRGLAIAGLAVSYVNVVVFVVFVAWSAGLDTGSAGTAKGDSGLQPIDTYVAPSTSASPAPVANRAVDVDVATSSHWFGVSVGDCIADYRGDVTREGDITVFSDLPVVPCDQPHYSEVYVIAEVEGDSPPPDAEAWIYLTGACEGLPFERYLGLPYEIADIEYVWLYPADSWWEAGNHQFVCMVVGGDGDTVGSVRAQG